RHVVAATPGDTACRLLWLTGDRLRHTPREAVGVEPMERRTFSPVVLAGGLIAAALVGFVAAREFSGTDVPSVTTPLAAGAPADAGVAAGIPDATEATEATIDPADDEATPKAPESPSTPASSERARPEPAAAPAA